MEAVRAYEVTDGRDRSGDPESDGLAIGSGNDLRFDAAGREQEAD